MPARPSTFIQDGRKEVAVTGTAERLVATSLPCKEVIITAEDTNTGVIVVGTSTVVASAATRRGTPLTAGASLVLDVDDAFKVYLDTTVNTDGVTYIIVGGE